MVVVGLGRAGRARVRDLGTSQSFELRGTVSRRPGAGTLTWEKALGDAAIGAVAICTENALHEGLAREALRAGKHVLVEYPLALSERAGAELFDLAAEQRRHLHVEHLELLSPAYLALRTEVRRRGELREGRVHFRGSSEGWIGDPALAGPPSFAGIARLCRMVDLFGVLTAGSASSRGGRLEVLLRTASGGALTWVEERAPGARHGTSLRFEFADGGTIEGMPPGRGGPLFAADLALFADELAGRRDPGPDQRRERHCLALAEAIRALCG